MFTNKEYSRYYAKSFCMKWRLGMDKYNDGMAHFKVHPSFSHAVENLPKLQTANAELSEEDKDTWLAFFREFGTHYMNEIHLGGKYMQEAILTKEAEKKSRKRSKETKHEFSVQIGLGKGGKGGKRIEEKD